MSSNQFAVAGQYLHLDSIFAKRANRSRGLGPGWIDESEESGEGQVFLVPRGVRGLAVGIAGCNRQRAQALARLAMKLLMKDGTQILIQRRRLAITVTMAANFKYAFRGSLGDEDSASTAFKHDRGSAALEVEWHHAELAETVGGNGAVPQDRRVERRSSALPQHRVRRGKHDIASIQAVQIPEKQRWLRRTPPEIHVTLQRQHTSGQCSRFVTAQHIHAS